MPYLIIGLVLFLGVHSIRIVAEDTRTRLRAQWGANTYKGIYTLVSLLGFGLIVWGFGVARETPSVLWMPPTGMRHLAALLTLLAFVLLAAAYVPGNAIKARVHHPMVLSVKVWAFAHLLANGNLVVAGEKQIGVNQNVDVMRFSGTVNPRLLQPNNIISSTQVAIPALLALSAIHQHLVREGLRTTAGLVVETGTAREVHHFAVLAGYGAEAVHPYLAMETLQDIHKDLPGDLSADKAIYNYIKAIGKGLSKIMSKMGVSTYMSYCGAQLFEAIGINTETINKYFTGTASRVGGIGVFEIAEESIRTHKLAFGDSPVAQRPGQKVPVEHMRLEQHLRPPEIIEAGARGFDIHECMQLILADADGGADARQVDIVEALGGAAEINCGHEMFAFQKA